MVNHYFRTSLAEFGSNSGSFLVAKYLLATRCPLVRDIYIWITTALYTSFMENWSFLNILGRLLPFSLLSHFVCLTDLPSASGPHHPCSQIKIKMFLVLFVQIVSSQSDFAKLQEDAQLWSDLLFQSGGRLELPKCGFHTTYYDFTKEGDPIMRHTPEQDIIIQNEHKVETTIKKNRTIPN